MSSGADRRAPSSAPARGAPRTASLIAAGSQVLAEATAAEVSRALAGAGVRTILLKGPSFARWLYLADEPRTTLDVDLLVAPHDIAPAQAILARIGFSKAEQRSLRRWPRMRRMELSSPGSMGRLATPTQRYERCLATPSRLPVFRSGTISTRHRS